jgi:hypothetical protein
VLGSGGEKILVQLGGKPISLKSLKSLLDKLSSLLSSALSLLPSCTSSERGAINADLGEANKKAPAS